MSLWVAVNEKPFFASHSVVMSAERMRRNGKIYFCWTRWCEINATGRESPFRHSMSTYFSIVLPIFEPNNSARDEGKHFSGPGTCGGSHSNIHFPTGMSFKLKLNSSMSFENAWQNLIRAVSTIAPSREKPAIFTMNGLKPTTPTADVCVCVFFFNYRLVNSAIIFVNEKRANTRLLTQKTAFNQLMNI